MTEPSADSPLSSTEQARTKKRTFRSRSQWQAIVNDFHDSGLSQITFCKQRGIPVSSLSRWQRIFAQQTEVVAGQADFVDVTEPLALVPPASVTRDTDNTDWQVELVLGKGIVLRLRTA